MKEQQHQYWRFASLRDAMQLDALSSQMPF
jgi:hypothetical protein